MKSILIIGGGVAGLTAGIYLAKQGLDCQIFEKQPVAGGNLTGWNRQGHHIDNCVHWLTGTSTQSGYYKTWCEVGALGNGLVFQPDAFYASELNGDRIEMSADIEKAKRDMLALSPADAVEIEKFFDAVKSVMLAEGIYPNGNDGKRRLWALRMLSVMRRYHGMSLAQLGAKFVHPLLKKLFSDYIIGEFSAVALIYSYGNFAGGNAGLPVGGSYAMAQRMRKKFEDLGGKVNLGAEVDEIIMDKGRAEGVLLKDGTYVTGDYVICGCDPTITFNSLLGVEMPKYMAKQYLKKDALLYSSMHCAFACAVAAPFEGSLIIEAASEAFGYDRLVLREFSHEPGYSPADGGVIQTMVYLRESECREWIKLRKSDKAAYREKKRLLADEAERQIIARFPGLDGKIKLIDVWTPATYNRYFDSHVGAWMTMALTPKMALSAKKSRIPSLKNVYLATQWQTAPGGLPIAMTCGKNTAADIINRIGPKKLTQALKVRKTQTAAE